MPDAQQAPYDPLPYATPASPMRRPMTTVLAGTLLLIAGLGLLLIGGCFLIGAMLIVTNGFSGMHRDLRDAEQFLVFILYALTLVTVCTGLYLIAILFRNLRAVLESDNHP